MFGAAVKKSSRLLHPAAVVGAAWLLSLGCRSGAVNPPLISVATPEELAAVQARALQQMRPLVLLIAESKHSQADDDAITALKSLAARNENGSALLAVLDVSVSKARATATRFHALETPLFIYLTPHGVLLSRDQIPISENLNAGIIRNLVFDRMRQLTERWSELDANFARLEAAAEKNRNDVAAQLKLAEFFVEHRNELEAIPVLAAVAHSQTVDNVSRIRAWTKLVQAHFWVAEPEKARHEALDMIATLGAAEPQAVAAANFVLGAHDALNVNRLARARQELEAAAAAAPDSTYGKQAAEVLAKLPKGGSTP